MNHGTFPSGCSSDMIWTVGYSPLFTKARISTTTKILATFLILLGLCGFASSTWAAIAALPSDANVINVKDPRFGAYGDSVHDDTAAIQAAIRYFDSERPNTRYKSPQFIYFPPGVYKVSKTLDNNNGTGRYNCSVQFWGAGTNDVIIKLEDNCSGFTNAAIPNPFSYGKAKRARATRPSATQWPT